MTLRHLLAVVVVALVAAVGVLTWATRDPWPSDDGLTVVTLVALAAIALIVLRQQPRNGIGWLLGATAVLGLLDTAARLYLVLDFRRHGGSLALGSLALAYRTGVTIVPFVIALPAILLFPNGTAPSGRWRRALRAYTVFAIAFSTVQFGAVAVHSFGRSVVVNVRGAAPNVDVGTVAGFSWVVAPLFLFFWIGFVVHQARRWRVSSGDERAQLKWLIAGAAICVASSVALVSEGDGTSLTSRIVGDVAVVGIAALPVAVGVAILKYRLYEIDRLISRTLSYAVVTATVAAVFLGIVALTTDVLPFSSPVGVAASTLAAASLFNPLRIRVQRLVDRRFNRTRYDAERIVAAFSRRVRDALDPETVASELATTVLDAVEPARVGVWTRGAS